MKHSSTTMKNSSPSKYMKQLDGLRAVAVFAVLWTHYLSEKYWLFDIYWGGIGVRIFFVLSGFLITGILLKCRQYVASRQQTPLLVLRQFYIRRFLRIFPLFYLTLAVTAILNIPPVRETLTWHLLYLSNIYFAIRGDYNYSISHLWSLAVEEQFYLVWPWLILFLPKKLLLPGIISVIFIGPVFRLISIMVGLNQVAIWVLTPSFLDILGLGSLLAYLNQQEQSSLSEKTFTKACLFIGCCLLLLIQILNRKYDYTIVDKLLGETAIGMICTWLVAKTAKGFSGIVGKVLEYPAVVYLGKISYGIYLIHLFTPYLIRQGFHILGLSAYSSKSIIMAVLSTVMTLILAIISWHFFEKKINDLKKFFPYTS